MSSPTSTRSSSTLSRPLPANTIDAHTHIIPPDFDKFPIHTGEYRPSPHTVSDAVTYYSSTSGLNITSPRMVLTQVSVYGTDNSALQSGLDELSELSGASNRAGVIDVDPKTTSPSDLDNLWDTGVRGLRTNLVSVSRNITASDLQALLQSQIDLLARTKIVTSRQKKWVLDLFINLTDQTLLLSVLPHLKNSSCISIVVAHFGGLKLSPASPKDPYQTAGFKDLVTLLTHTKDWPEVYVKLSAPYRVDNTYPSPEAQERFNAVGKELMRVAPGRCVWASDWPHTRFGEERAGTREFVEQCYTWCSNEVNEEALFRTNAEKLYTMSS